MSDLNKCCFIGRLGKDPELKSFSNGGTITNFTLAVNRKVKQQDNNYVDKVEWINIELNGNLQKVCNYLHKGSKIYLEGEFRTTSVQKQDGSKQYYSKIIAKDVIFLDSNKQENNNGNNERYNQNQQAIVYPADNNDEFPF